MIITRYKMESKRVGGSHWFKSRDKNLYSGKKKKEKRKTKKIDK